MNKACTSFLICLLPSQMAKVNSFPNTVNRETSDKIAPVFFYDLGHCKKVELGEA